jgi:co-chaperonin GroES (HSP10)
MMNQSGIHPIEYQVLVKDMETERKTAGGIILTDETISMNEGRQMRGTVLEVSPVAWNYLDEEYAYGAALRKRLPGMTVGFAKYAGATVMGKDDQEYRLLNDRDITNTFD